MSPLDLRAVEARLNDADARSGDWRRDARALLDQCRALRAALQEFQTRLDVAEANGKYQRRRVAGVYVDRERFERAAAVLALAHDQAPREAEPKPQ